MPLLSTVLNSEENMRRHSQGVDDLFEFRHSKLLGQKVVSNAEWIVMYSWKRNLWVLSGRWLGFGEIGKRDRRPF